MAYFTFFHRSRLFGNQIVSASHFFPKDRIGLYYRTVHAVWFLRNWSHSAMQQVQEKEKDLQVILRVNTLTRRKRKCLKIRTRGCNSYEYVPSIPIYVPPRTLIRRMLPPLRVSFKEFGNNSCSSFFSSHSLPV